MREVDAVNVVIQTFFGFPELNITGSNFYDGKLLANSSILIFLSSRDFKLTITFRFFAIFPKYFNPHSELPACSTERYMNYHYYFESTN